MKLAKWQGLGNDYLVVEESALPGPLTTEIVSLLCDRHLGVGADGILLHGRPTGAVPGAVARMRVFNPDGGEPEMCGNGIRIFARYLARTGAVAEPEFIVETLAGAIRPRLLSEGSVRVDMGRARFRSANIRAASETGIPADGDVVDAHLIASGQEYRLTFVDVGNPHCVIRVDDPATFDVAGVGAAVERHPVFPHRVNVEFVRVEADGSVRMRVWERGVGETQACGTGATAVGAACVRLGLVESPVLVRLLGGDLVIEVGFEEDDGWPVFMTGPAEEVFACELSSEFLRRVGWPGGAGAPAQSAGAFAGTTTSGGPQTSPPATRPATTGNRPQLTDEEAAVRFSRRMDNLAPYLFAEMERKVAEKRASGVDVISLGIGDPDLPTPAFVVEEMRRQVADPRNHRYPSNWGLPEFAEAAASFYKRRFGVELDATKEFFPLLGAKEGLAHICWALLDAGDLALVPDPGYPVYAGGSLLVGAEVRYLLLRPEKGFLPDLEEISEEVARRAKVLFIGYPNNPTAGIVEDDFFERVVVFAKKYDIAVVHDNAYSELTYDGYVAPSFLAAPGAKDVGVELFSFSKPFNMTGWRIGFAVGNRDILAHLWRLKTNLDSGVFDALQRTAAFMLNGPWDFVQEMCEVYRRRRDLLAEALISVGMEVPKPKGTIYMWIPVPSGYTSASFSEHVLEQAAVVVTPGSGYGPAGEGFVRLSLTTPDDRIAEAVERIERSLRL